MKKHLVTHLVALVAICCFLLAADGAFARQRRPRNGSAPTAGAAHGAGGRRRQSRGACKAYIVMEAASGRVLEEQNMHEKRAPASMTKLMLA